MQLNCVHNKPLTAPAKLENCPNQDRGRRGVVEGVSASKHIVFLDHSLSSLPSSWLWQGVMMCNDV